MSLDISNHSVKEFLNHCLDDSCLNTNMDRREKKYANRRARLEQAIAERAAGNKAEFGRLYGYTRSQIAQYTSSTYNDGFSMGEGVIEKLEERLDLPPGWFDWPADGSTGWPFQTVDEKKIRKLKPAQLIAVEAAILIAAGQVGLDVKTTE